MKFFTFLMILSQSLAENCKQDLLESYGLKSLGESQTLSINICPSVKESCVEDSVKYQIVDQYIAQGEENNLRSQIADVKIIYDDMIETMLKIKIVSQKIQTKVAQKSVNSCQILANKIEQLQMDTVLVKLSASIQAMFSFFQQTYSGFYCALIDGENQKFFNFSNKEIFSNHKFCRQIASNTLKNLFYLHQFIPQLLSLTYNFISGCDSNGHYQDKTKFFNKIPKANIQIYNNLIRCKNSFENQQWLEDCEFICAQFNPVQIKEFFLPYLYEIQQYTQIANLYLENYKRQEQLTSGQEGFNLTEDDIIKVIKDFKKPPKVVNVYQAFLNAPFDLSSFSMNFTNDYGINFFKYGSESSINLTTLQETGEQVQTETGEETVSEQPQTEEITDLEQLGTEVEEPETETLETEQELTETEQTFIQKVVSWFSFSSQQLI